MASTAICGVNGCLSYIVPELRPIRRKDCVMVLPTVQEWINLGLTTFVAGVVSSSVTLRVAIYGQNKVAQTADKDRETRFADLCSNLLQKNEAIATEMRTNWEVHQRELRTLEGRTDECEADRIVLGNKLERMAQVNRKLNALLRKNNIVSGIQDIES